MKEKIKELVRQVTEGTAFKYGGDDIPRILDFRSELRVGWVIWVKTLLVTACSHGKTDVGLRHTIGFASFYRDLVTLFILYIHT
jgi:hypothetical protein